MNKISSYKKTKIEEETPEEFYLNPKDMINNDKIYDSTQTDLMIYLPLNELLIVLFEENIAVVDIKRTVSSNFTIVKMINHIAIHQECFNVQEEKKPKVPSADVTFGSFCFKVKEADTKKIKSVLAIENPSSLNELIILIEYLNLDLVILKYDNVYVKSKFKVIYSHRKAFFVKYKKQLKMNYESIMILNYKSKLYLVINAKESASSTTYVIHQVENLFLVYCVDNEAYTQIASIKVAVNAKVVAWEFHNDTLIQVIADVNNAVQCNFYSSFKLIHSQWIEKENEGNVTLIQFFAYMNKKIVVYAQLYHMMMFSVDDKSAHLTLMKKISFNQFQDWVISYCFILSDLLYIFNSSGDYSYNSLDTVENNTILSLNISRQVYSIVSFQTGIGLFILSTQNSVKVINVNITYFIPKSISQSMTLKRLIDVTAHRKSFFTLFLCEYLIFYIRFHLKVATSQEEGIELNEKSLIEQRLEIYWHQINNTVQPKQHEAIIALYQKLNNIKPAQYKFYLSNPMYKCDFCSSTFLSFDNSVYFCTNNHSTFSCSITSIPFTSSFHHCVNCELFYDNKYKICLICQKMLSCAI